MCKNKPATKCVIKTDKSSCNQQIVKLINQKGEKILVSIEELFSINSCKNKVMNKKGLTLKFIDADSLRASTSNSDKKILFTGMWGVKQHISNVVFNSKNDELKSDLKKILDQSSIINLIDFMEKYNNVEKYVKKYYRLYFRNKKIHNVKEWEQTHKEIAKLLPKKERYISYKEDTFRTKTRDDGTSYVYPITICSSQILLEPTTKCKYMAYLMFDHFSLNQNVNSKDIYSFLYYLFNLKIDEKNINEYVINYIKKIIKEQ